jgi:hypothetical protein
VVNKVICLKKIYRKKKFVIVVKYLNTKNKIFEKLGTYSIIYKRLNINVYRLIFFISKNTKITGSCMTVLKKFKVINNNSNIKAEILRPKKRIRRYIRKKDRDNAKKLFK